MIAHLLLAAAAVAVPLGLDLYVPAPPSNPLTPESIELGRQLFMDRRLSRDASISCASCHDPARAFSDSRAIATGVFGRVGRRNSPALINRGYGRLFFWDGRAATLEEQVLKPIEDPNEMDLSLAEASARLQLKPEAIAHALASFIRSLLSGNSRFDRYMDGNRSALSPDELLGLRSLPRQGQLHCVPFGSQLHDDSLHNTGVAWNGQTFSDGGRYEVTKRPEDTGRFKTPTLRDVSRTAPYMHDGSLATLADVVDYYTAAGIATAIWTPRFAHCTFRSGRNLRWCRS
jgi:cytochrome c peroxidase